MYAFDAPEVLHTLQDSGRNLLFITVSGTIGRNIIASMIEEGVDDCIDKGNPSNLDGLFIMNPG